MRSIATPALLCLCLTACDRDEEACVMPPAYRGSNLNGTNLNGSNLNGTNLNGSNLNGVSINGIAQQGHHLTNGATLSGVDVDGARIVDDEGRPVVLPVGAELPAQLSDGTIVALRIDATRRDGELDYYALSLAGTPLCADGADGLFVEGNWDDRGARHENAEFRATYSCTTGVIAKCVAWGYDPSRVGADVHQACTRMARADYCGDGVPHTVDGTTIDVFDDLGVLEPAGEEGFAFEAAWGPDGATCVSRPRYDERVVAIGDVLPACWDALPRCESFDEAQADGDGPHLANASEPQPLLLCEPR